MWDLPAELTYQIISQLTESEIISLTRVNKQFRDFIQSQKFYDAISKTKEYPVKIKKFEKTYIYIPPKTSVVQKVKQFITAPIEQIREADHNKRTEQFQNSYLKNKPLKISTIQKIKQAVSSPKTKTEEEVKTTIKKLSFFPMPKEKARLLPIGERTLEEAIGLIEAYIKRKHNSGLHPLTLGYLNSSPAQQRIIEGASVKELIEEVVLDIKKIEKKFNNNNLQMPPRDIVQVCVSLGLTRSQISSVKFTMDTFKAMYLHHVKYEDAINQTNVVVPTSDKIDKKAEEDEEKNIETNTEGNLGFTPK